MAIDILVVGTGPTGLTLALTAHLHGAQVLVIERRPELFRPSRALIAYPRTLEVLRPLGVSDALVAQAATAPEVCLHLGHRRIPVRLGTCPYRTPSFPTCRSFARRHARRPPLAGSRSRAWFSHVHVGYPPRPPWVEGTPALEGGPGLGHRVPDRPVAISTTLLPAPGVHVLLQRDATDVEPPPLGPGVTVHRLESYPGRGLVAVRPDGYVGYRCGVADGASLRDWLARAGSQCRHLPGSPGRR